MLSDGDLQRIAHDAVRERADSHCLFCGVAGAVAVAVAVRQEQAERIAMLEDALQQIVRPPGVEYLDWLAEQRARGWETDQWAWFSGIAQRALDGENAPAIASEGGADADTGGA